VQAISVPVPDDGAPRGAAADWARRMQTALGRVLGLPVALLVAAEIGVLLAGVIARYVFHSPLIWSDELASILFLWLAMLGSAIAFERGDHMRMTAVVSKLQPATRAFLDLLATAAALAFLVLILPHAWEYADWAT
jgi:TRAP-type C4-dicarboxylate transport system permease small subunit